MKIARKLICCLFLLILMSSISRAKTSEIEWTEDEQDFINEHPMIHLGVDPKFVPFEFFDSDGKYKGIASDYIRLLSDRIGIEMVIEQDKTWAEAYELAVEKKLDVLPCISKTLDREQYFIFSDAYYTFQRVIVIKDTNKNIRKFEDLSSTKVAVQSNSSHHSFLKEYPDLELSLYTNVEDALAAVASGTETAFVGNLATTNYLIKANGITDLKYIKIDSEEKQTLHFAVRNDWPELVGIINKGLASITEEEKIEIYNHWIGVENEIDYGPFIKIIAIVGAIIAIIIVVSFYWIVLLRKEISKRKKTEEDLRRAKREADVANQVKSSFLARMSHEIRTPLNGITGMAYLLKKTDINLTQKIYLEKITQAAHNMLNIINDILDFSKIEAGKVDIEKIPFSLDNVLQQVVNIVAFRIEEQGINFSMSKDPQIPVDFIGDPKRLEQILLNIINNAIKFTKEGEVNLDVNLSSVEDTIYQLEFKVTDTGIGMSLEQVSQLFEPFTQADSSINRRFGGTGLGLSIVKSFVDMMGGETKVFSAEGKGSTFIIYLPFEVDLNKAEEDKKRVKATYFNDVKILVLEKNSASSSLINRYFEAYGITAEFAISSYQAIQLLTQCTNQTLKPYDLIIIDYDTPTEGGFDFVMAIRNNPAIMLQPKIMMLIPLTRDDLFEKIEEMGIEMGITKPIIPSVLYNGILEVFKIQVLESQELLATTNEQTNISLEYAFHVLVVEDNKTNQFIAQSILEQAGLSVSLADDGAEGVAYFADHQDEVDVILMDLHMPVLNGYDAAAQIRKMDKKIPIIAMTADAISGVEEKCSMAGINYYISKPFDPERFVDTILSILTKHHSDALASVNAGQHQVEDMVILNREEGLRRVGNNYDLYQMILLEYLKENKDILEPLRLAIEEKNYEQAIQIVHKNKGSSGNIGAKSLYETAKELQKALESGVQKDIEPLFRTFSDLLNQLFKEIEAPK